MLQPINLEQKLPEWDKEKQNLKEKLSYAETMSIEVKGKIISLHAKVKKLNDKNAKFEYNLILRTFLNKQLPLEGETKIRDIMKESNRRRSYCKR